MRVSSEACILIFSHPGMRGSIHGVISLKGKGTTMQRVRADMSTYRRRYSSQFLLDMRLRMAGRSGSIRRL